MTFYHYWPSCQTIVCIITEVFEMKWLLENSNSVLSKEKLKSYLLRKLNSLYKDVNSAPEDTTSYLSFIKRTEEEKRKIIMDLYAGYYAPAKVTDYSGLPKRRCDMTGEMLDFVENFDKYIASLEDEYNYYIRQKREAVALLAMILSLRQPYSRILYLRYYKNMPPEKMCIELHIARSTLFRKRNDALEVLAEMFAENNNLVLQPD